MSVTLLVVRALLAAVFAVAGVSKLVDLAGSRKSMADFGVPALLVRPLAILLPLAELCCAIGLIPVTSAWWAAMGVLAMLLVFIAGISINLARGRTPDCHCFGQLHSSPVGWKTLVRNGSLSVAAIFVVWQGKDDAGVNLMSLWGNLNRLESIVALLAVAVVGLAALELWTLFHLLRQNGRLMLRLEAVEGRAGARVEPSPPGLPFDAVAPPFRLETLEGGTVGLDTLIKAGKPLILVFSEPGCGACDELLPAVGQWQREYADALTIVPISRGDVKVNRAKSTEHKLQNMLLQADREVAGAYLVEATPSAVLITEGRIASPLAVGPDMIRALVGRATLPPSVKKGESVPSLRFADLEGKTVDLAKLRGRRRLLLFWNPTCGFCQQMLEDVRTWERNPPPEAPELLVISAGTYDGIREQGFRSQVLLDPNFGAGQVFSAAGTPAAVLLDEDGRVASDVGVGTQAVLALAGAVPVGNHLGA